MSKSTKIIAGLGVAAALGVAALPMASFAANYSAVTSVTATIPNSITIEYKDNGAENYTQVTQNDSQATGGHAMGTFATVAFGSNGNVAVGHGYEIANRSYIKVTTNYPAGYTFSADTTDLLNDTTEGATAQSIPDFASATVVNTAATDVATSGWGIQIAKDGTVMDAFKSGDNAAYKGSAGTVDTVNGLTAKTTHEYTISYGLNVALNQAAETYTGTATYTVASDATLATGA